MRADRFRHFLAIDWSGAKGERHKGIALAIAGSDGGPPALIERDRPWSREEVLSFLRHDLPRDTLVGLDLGISLPFVDCSAYFPGVKNSPSDAVGLWKLVDELCEADLNLSANSFIQSTIYKDFFRNSGGFEGTSFRCDNADHGRGRFRVTEHAQARMGCKPYSNFNLVGAAQVGKSSLTGMRMLHALRGHLPVWPVDKIPDQGSVIVEIYTSLAAIEAGRSAGKAKMRNYDELNEALGALGSPPMAGSGPIDDHSSDALLTAAWLRKVAPERRRWAPQGLTRHIAKTEGWTFGAF